MTDVQRHLELLNAAHEFPCAYTFKVIGSASDDFVLRVVAVVQAALNSAAEPPYRTRSTPGGRHVSVTLEPIVESAEQVLRVYDHIRTVKGVHLSM